MARNVEIKARVSDRALLIERLRSLAGLEPAEISQDDTFFPCPQGRLKLRAFADGSGKLIFYRRADQTGPKESFFVVSETPDAQSLRETLGQALGVAGRVRKQRTVFVIGSAHVHVDRVEGLGDFVEIEVVLADGQPLASGEQAARSLMLQLQIREQDLVEAAYRDLLEAQAHG